MKVLECRFQHCFDPVKTPTLEGSSETAAFEN